MLAGVEVEHIQVQVHPDLGVLEVVEMVALNPEVLVIMVQRIQGEAEEERFPMQALLWQVAQAVQVSSS